MATIDERREFRDWLDSLVAEANQALGKPAPRGPLQPVQPRSSVKLSSLIEGIPPVDPYPDMTSTYDSTREAMRKVRKAAAGGAAKKVAKKGAEKVVKGAVGAAAKQAAGRVGGMFGGIPGWLAGTIGAGLIFELLPRLTHGSTEDQMREQMQIQKKIEMEEIGASGSGAMGGMAGIGAAPDEPSMYSLKEAESDSLGDLAFANKRNRALRSINQSSSSDELAGLLAGQETRLRSLQSPRQLTPYEIMDILGG